MSFNPMIDQSEEELEEVKTTMNYMNKTLEEKRQLILSLMPEISDSIQNFNESEINQILQQALANEEQDENGENEEEERKNSLIERFSQQFPEMTRQKASEFYNDFGYDGLLRIYQEMKNEQNKISKKTPVLQKPQAFKTGKEVMNGELNIYEMKKTLTERMPQYRQEIKNMSEEELKNIFKELQYQDPKPDHYEDSSEKLEERYPRRRGRPRKNKTQSTILEERKRECMQNDHAFEEYRLKSGYDLATPINNSFQNNLQPPMNIPLQLNGDPINHSFHNSMDPFSKSKQKSEKKRQSPYTFELNSQINSGKERPFCQITINLSKEDFTSEKKMEETMKAIKQISKGMEKE